MTTETKSAKTFEFENPYSGEHDTSLDHTEALPKYEPGMSENVTDEKNAVLFDGLSSSSLAPPELPSVPITAFPFTIDPSRTLTINAKGIKWLRLPTPSSQLEIAVSSANSGILAYTSTRWKRSSGDCILRSATDFDADKISTQYAFGPNREPKIKLHKSNHEANLEHVNSEDDAGEIETQVGKGVEILQVKSKWTSRSISLVNTGFGGGKQPSNAGVFFEWRYLKAEGFLDDTKDVDISKEISESSGEGSKQKGKSKKERSTKILALTVKDTSHGASVLDSDSKWYRRSTSEPDNIKIIAQLIRTRETRTEGTRDSDAGNGGHLLFDVDAEKYMAENLIVATCLMMLKKEVDRRRTAQFAIMSAMACGHGS